MSGHTPRRLSRTAAALLTVTLLASCSSPTQDDSKVETWKRGGADVSTDVINTNFGSAHCGQQQVRFLHVGFPIQPDPNRLPKTDQYVRDPQALLGDGSLARALRLNAALPDDAKPTGYTRDSIELWLADSDRDSFAYLVTGNPPQVEAWPRADPAFGCD
jgi:hypothetical protein